MDLKRASEIVDKALEVAHKNKLKPMTVAVLDAGGHLIAFKKEDGAPIFREQIARGKALGALGLGADSSSIAKVAADRPAFIQAVMAATEGKIIPAAGGILIFENGKVIGACGISGDVSEADEWCAVEGVKASGYSCNAIKEKREPFLKAHL